MCVFHLYRCVHPPGCFKVCKYLHIEGIDSPNSSLVHLHNRSLLGPHEPLLWHQGVQWRGRAGRVGVGWSSDRGHPELPGWRRHPGERWGACPCQRHPWHAYFCQLHPFTAWWQTVCLVQWHSGEEPTIIETKRAKEFKSYCCVVIVYWSSPAMMSHCGLADKLNWVRAKRKINFDLIRNQHLQSVCDPGSCSDLPQNHNHHTCTKTNNASTISNQ